MWLRRLTNYLLEHRWLTLALTFFVTFIPLLYSISIVIAAFITLRKGVVEGLLVTVAATLPFALGAFASGNQVASIPLYVWAGVGVAISSNLLTWVFAVMLRRQASWSMILQVAALLGVLVVSVVHLAYPNVSDWWGVQLQSYYTQASSAFSGALKSAPAAAQAAAPAPSDAQLEAINVTKQFATGVFAVGILVMALLQLIVAQWWQAKVFNPGSLKRDLHNIRLSQLAGILFVLSVILSFYGNTVVIDLMPVVYALFCAAGLSVVHYLFGLMTSPTRWFWLLMFYFTVLFALPVSGMIIAIIALSDIWYNIRKRVQKA